MKNHEDHDMETRMHNRAGFKQPALMNPTRAQSQREVPGIELLYFPDRADVAVGETVTFTAWLLNSRDEALTEISLHLRSLRNDRLDDLAYTAAPTASELSRRTLGPGQSLSFTLVYKATPADAMEGGLLISALRMELFTTTHGRLVSDCDAYAQVVISHLDEKAPANS
ncbi:hypothetical protein ART_2425 [Arthrobacter sp. PAMC 25486]|uniref:hypothetical protein n=1 Tax=Arthrobacter sp. PAMC 25486 TaxID=1494608 RepID=UPI000535F4F6|nr:hypothetical protein [Arthrobacter sp. PAMC 25486]AIY02024.1 hypothetical protein ART_2425 [Arthrobacter sp. PAMC 25486]